MSDAFTLTLGGLEVQCGDPAGAAPGVVTLALRGDLDSLSVPVLRQALDRVYGSGGYTIRLDLSGLDFIDSSGLGALVGAWRHCSGHDGSVTAVSPNATVRQLMDVTGISRFLLPR